MERALKHLFLTNLQTWSLLPVHVDLVADFAGLCEGFWCHIYQSAAAVAREIQAAISVLNPGGKILHV